MGFRFGNLLKQYEYSKVLQIYIQQTPGNKLLTGRLNEIKKLN